MILYIHHTHCTASSWLKELCGECAIVSYDHGRTWETYYVLDDRASAKGGDLGYPATVELDDGSLMTIYYQKYEDDPNCSILYTRWNPEQRKQFGAVPMSSCKPDGCQLRIEELE